MCPDATWEREGREGDLNDQHETQKDSLIIESAKGWSPTCAGGGGLDFK